jgi:parallel beta-helix repeat protein
MVLILLLTSMLSSTFIILSVKAESATIYIRADGSVDPPDAPIATNDNITYILIDNIISSYHGIVIYRSNVVIDGNGHMLQGSNIGCGVVIDGANNVTLKNINIKGFGTGVLIQSSYNVIYKNKITNNNRWGINVFSGLNNEILENLIMNNYVGILLRSNSKVSENNITANSEGIRVNGNSNTISRNKVKNNDVGISLSLASNNNVWGNDVTANGRGVCLYSSTYNNVWENNITANNLYGIYVGNATNNSFYHNNIIDNAEQVRDDSWYYPTIPSSVNVWDDGYPSGGNYWSDYAGVDLKSGPNQDQPGSDGIGDTPYIIDNYNRDRYPLTKPWGSKWIVLVVADPSFSDEYIKGWTKPFYDHLLGKYAVTVISHSKVHTFNFTLYDAAVITWDPTYITEPKDYSNLLNSGIGFVFMSADVEKVGLGSGAGYTSYGTTINIVDNTHYITSPFSMGNLQVYSVEGYRNYMQRANDTTLLANIPKGDIIAVKGNRVYFGLPCAKGLTLNGWTLFDRSVQFVITAPAPPAPPIASYTYSPLEPIAGETVTFDASASYDPDGGPIVNYRWEFYRLTEGAIIWPPICEVEGSDKVVISYAFGKGDYLVVLTVTDDEGLTSRASKTICVRALPDFSIYEVKPVQVIWDCDINNDGRIDLVAGKPTMVRVIIEMRNYEMLDKDTTVEIWMSMPNIVRVEYRTIKELEENNKVDFYILEGDPDFYLFSSIPQGDYRILAKVDSKNVIEEADENNNEKIVEISIKDTKAPSIIYMRIGRPEYGILDEKSFYETVNKCNEFLKAVYPISETEFRYEISSVIVEGNPKGPFGWGVNMDCVTMSEIAKLYGFDRAIGIPPFEYINYHGVDWSGKSLLGVPAGVVVVDGYWTTAAHEVGHTYGLKDEEELGKPASGLWVTKMQVIESRHCFMGQSTYKTLDENWICRECYEHLFKKFIIDKKDPEILVVSGIIYKNDTLELGRWFEVEEGKDDLEELTPGDYLLQILDEKKDILQEVSFDANFRVTIYSETIETDFAFFAFAIPYPQNVSMVRILHKQKIIAEVNLSTKLFEDAINSLPWYYNCLINTIEKLTIQEGFKDSLTSKLSNARMKLEQAMTYINEGNNVLAKNMLNSALNIIEAFTNEVNAQKGKKISAAYADGFVYWVQKTILRIQDFVINNF